jgi:hypothetical protein
MNNAPPSDAVVEHKLKMQVCIRTLDSSNSDDIKRAPPLLNAEPEKKLEETTSTDLIFVMYMEPPEPCKTELLRKELFVIKIVEDCAEK